MEKLMTSFIIIYLVFAIALEAEAHDYGYISGTRLWCSVNHNTPAGQSKKLK